MVWAHPAATGLNSSTVTRHSARLFLQSSRHANHVANSRRRSPRSPPRYSARHPGPTCSASKSLSTESRCPSCCQTPSACARHPDALKGATPDKYGLVAPRILAGTLDRTPLLSICVARSSMPRALRIVGALLKAMAARGFVSRQGQIEMRGQTIAFWIREAVNQVDHVPTSKELEEQRRWSWSHPPRWDYEPSGKLVLKVTSSRARDSARRGRSALIVKGSTVI